MTRLEDGYNYPPSKRDTLDYTTPWIMTPSGCGNIMTSYSYFKMGRRCGERSRLLDAACRIHNEARGENETSHGFGGSLENTPPLIGASTSIVPLIYGCLGPIHQDNYYGESLHFTSITIDWCQSKK